MKTKQCISCNEVKGENEFYKTKKSKDGLEGSCKACRRKRDKINEEKRKLRNRKPSYIEDLENEKWKDIKGYEGIYQVSNLGRVKRLDTIDDFGVYRKGKLMALQLNACGYVVTRIVNKHSIRKTVSIHRLVAQSFIFNSDNKNKNEVNHIDGNKLNNNVSNLEWCTRQENVQHSFKTGLHVASRKCRNDIHRSKPVLQILNGKIIKEYPSAMEASRQTGFSQGGISNCCRGNQPTVYGYVWKYK